MDYRKIDAALAIALEDIKDPEEPTLVVFVYIEKVPSSDESAFLGKMGVGGETGGKQIFTATLSARAVTELSEQPWIRYLKLSKKLSLLQKNSPIT